MKVHSINYEITSFLVNSQGHLGLYQLLNILQDAASTHAQKIGIGYQQMAQIKMFWVLTRQHLKMQQWPKWHDIITIKTWVRAQDTVASNRDFRIYLGDELIGECTTNWLPLNAENRKPVAWDRSSVMGEHQNSDKVSIETTKIAPRSDSEILTTFDVRNSDIDRNMHVNNTKYAQWILDAVPFDHHSKFTLNDYQVNFLAETKLSDEIRIERTRVQDHLIHFQGIRVSDEKPVFTALLGLQEK